MIWLLLFASVAWLALCIWIARRRGRAARLPAEGGRHTKKTERSLVFAHDGRRAVYWDTRRTPHIAVAGATGKGKTVTLHAIIRRAIKSRWRIFIVDPKKFELVGFTGHPGVAEVAHDRAGMERVIRTVKAELDDRQRRRLADELGRDRKAKPVTFQPLLLVVDEVSELVEITTPERGKSTAVADLGSIMRLGRALDIHVAVATQQFDVKEALPSSVRRQCDAQIGLGKVGRIGRQMLGWTEQMDRCPDDSNPGQATFAVGGKAQLVTVDYAPPPRPLATPANRNLESSTRNPNRKAPKSAPVVASPLPVILDDWSDQ